MRDRNDLVEEDRFLELVRRFPLRPIRDDKGLDRAIEAINALLDRDDLEPPEEDYLDVLGDLVRKFEVGRHPRRPVASSEILRHLLEAREVGEADLARGAGLADEPLAEILSGRREPDAGEAEALAAFFHVGPNLFSAG